jgi:hypothetical protein
LASIDRQSKKKQSTPMQQAKNKEKLSKLHEKSVVAFVQFATSSWMEQKKHLIDSVVLLILIDSH